MADLRAHREAMAVRCQGAMHARRTCTLVLSDGVRLDGVVRSMSLNGDPDPHAPNDPVTVLLRGRVTPVALGSIEDVI